MNPFDAVVSVFSGGTFVTTLILSVKIWPILKRLAITLEQHDLMWSEFSQRHGLGKRLNGGTLYGKQAD